MEKTKKLLSAAFLGAGLLVLSGCGANQTPNPPPATSQTPSTQAQPTQPATPDQNQPVEPTAQSQPATGQMQSVTIKNFSFSPATLTVKQGTTVTWTNQDSATHTVNSATFNSKNLATGESFSFTFANKGTFDYSCGIHPSMVGKIIVE